jgi:hypothetical protein
VILTGSLTGQSCCIKFDRLSGWRFCKKSRFVELPLQLSGGDTIVEKLKWGYWSGRNLGNNRITFSKIHRRH